jgi:hypothetical protein
MEAILRATPVGVVRRMSRTGTGTPVYGAT